MRELEVHIQFMTYKDKRIGVVVPAYNEEKLLGRTLSTIPGYVDRVFIVDDCSTDKTSEIAKEFAENSKFVYIRHDVNGGVGAGIISGFKEALKNGIDIIAVMAGDNQMDPMYLDRLINPILEYNADFTKGNRLIPGYWRNMSKWRLLGNMLLDILTKIASGYWNINDPENGYVAISSQSLTKLNLDDLRKGFEFENDIMTKCNIVGVRMMSVPIPAVYGEENSKIKYGNFIVNTSMFLFFSFLWRIWVKYLLGFHPIGFLYLAGIGFILSGIILIGMSGNCFVLSFGVVLFILACYLERRNTITFLGD